MRKSLLLGIATLSLLFAASTAGASTLNWVGTLTLDLGPFPTGVDTGVGVATVNASGVGAHLDTLRLEGGLGLEATIPVTDPESTATIVTVIIDATLGTGTLGQISGGGALSPGALPLLGLAKVCIFFAGCSNSLPLDLGANPSVSGVGVGGLLTIGGAGPIRISIEAGPWQMSVGTRLQQTDNGAIITRMSSGFAHGPESLTSSTALASGVVQVISPMQVLTKGLPGNSEKIALFTTLSLHFIPEPGLLLLLGSGVVGLALIGRSRMKS